MPTTAPTRLPPIPTTQKAVTRSNRNAVAEATVTVALDRHLETMLPNKETPVTLAKNENRVGNGVTLEIEPETPDAVVEN